MLTDQLKYFSLVYKTRNYSQAARRVPMSVQGITKAMKSIESELGVVLFVPDENGVLAPTRYADELEEFVQRYDDNRLILEESFNRIRSQEKHELRVGFCVGILGHLGPRFLLDFYERYPDLTINYNEFNDETCDRGLKQGAFDLAFTLYPYEKDFVTTELYTTKMEYWVNRSNPLSAQLSAQEHLKVENLDGCTIAIPGKSYKCFNSLLALCDSKGVKLRQVYEITEIFRIFEFVLAGHGLGYTTRSMSRLEVFTNNDNVVALPFENEVWHFGISYLPSHRLTEPEQRFYEYCCDYAKTMQNL